MKQKVSIIIALSVVAVLAAVFWGGADGSITNTPPKNGTIVAFGDSLVEGVGSERGGGFVSLLAQRTGRNIVNLGVAGETTADGLQRVSEVLAYDPGVVLILFGGNDAMRRTPIEETRGNLADMIRRFHEAGIVVVLLGVRGGILGDPYEDMYAQLSTELGTAFVPNILQGILLKPELTADRFHPNDKGYRVMADRIAPVLIDILNGSDDV